ncbi:MAG: hypothetical protein R3E68_01680 [Burkholderiaceae bacterium]
MAIFRFQPDVGPRLRGENSCLANLSAPRSAYSHDMPRPTEQIMLTCGGYALVVGGALSATAALAHVACIIIGAPAYRFMGAGAEVIRAVEAGSFKPTLITLTISVVLLVWAAYALAGAGVIGRLPLLKPVLVVICLIYVARAIAFPLLKPAFRENSQAFWLVSSGICLVIGLVHLYGVMSSWRSL